jgi:hypothetical protein
LNDISIEISYGSQGQIRMISYFLMRIGHQPVLLNLWKACYKICLSLFDKYSPCYSNNDWFENTYDKLLPNDMISQLISIDLLHN